MKRKYINEQQLSKLISEKVRKHLFENFFGNENFYSESDNDERLSDMNSESDDEQETRDSIESFFKQDGVNTAAYAYQLYNVKTVEGDDTDEIKKASEELSNAVMELSSRVYQEQAAESQANAENTETADDEETKNNVKDADFEEK